VCFSFINSQQKNKNLKMWGANSTTLKQIYKSLILSKLEYGAFLYIDAKQSTLKMIETIHNAGLILAIGTFLSNLPHVFSIFHALLHLT